MIENQFYRGRPNLQPQQAALLETANTILSKRDIEIQKGEYNNKEWSIIFTLIQQSKSNKLSLCTQWINAVANQAQIDLRPIFVPRFTHMKELYLSCNRIVSIDAISSLHAPNLQDLVILTNHITSIKSLRKAYFPALKEINLSNNPIQNPTPLTEMCSRVIEEIHLQRWPNWPLIGQSKRWACKLYPGRDLKALTLKSYARRPQLHIDRMIQAKYPRWRIR